MMPNPDYKDPLVPKQNSSVLDVLPIYRVNWIGKEIPVSNNDNEWPEQLTIIRYEDGGFSATVNTPPDNAKFVCVYTRTPSPAQAGLNHIGNFAATFMRETYGPCPESGTPEEERWHERLGLLISAISRYEDDKQ